MAFSVAFIYEAIDKVSPILNKVKAKQKEVARSMNAGFKKVGTTLDKTSKKLKNVANRLDKVGSRMSAIGRTITTKITAPLLALGATAVFQGGKFEDAMASLSAITGLAGADLSKMKKEIMKTAEQFGIGSSELAKGMELIGSKQPALLKTPKLLLAVAKASSIMAKAAGQELPIASENLLSIMNAFEIGGEDALKTVNMLAAASKFGAAAIPELSEAIKRAAGGAKIAKVPLHDLIGAIEVLAEKSGLPAQTIGIGLQNALLKLEAQTNKKIKPSVVGLSKAMENLGKMNLSASKLTKLFGIENVKIVVPMIANAKAMGLMGKKIQGTQTALEQAKIRMATFNEQAKRLWTTIKNKLIAIFDVMRPVLSKILKVIRIVIEKLSVWAKKNPKLAKTIAFIAIALGILGPVLIGVGGIITAVSTIIAGVSVAMVVIVAKIGLVIAGIATLAAGMLFFASGASEATTWGQRLALMWQTLQEAAAMMWAEIEPIITDLKNSFRTLIPVFQAMWPFIQPLLKGAFLVQLGLIVGVIKAMLLPLQAAAKLLALITGATGITESEERLAKAQARLDAMQKAKAAGVAPEIFRKAEITALDLSAMSEERRAQMAKQQVSPVAKSELTGNITVTATPGTEIDKTESTFKGEGNVGLATTGAG